MRSRSYRRGALRNGSIVKSDNLPDKDDAKAGERKNRGDGAFGREARTEKDPACSPKYRTKQLPRPVDNVSVFESDTVEARQGKRDEHQRNRKKK